MSAIYIKEQTVQFDNDGLGNISISQNVPVVQPVPVPPEKYPVGKGLLIWNLNDNYLQTVARLVDLGVKWVAPKVVNGINPSNDKWINDFIVQCRRAGIDVWGWGYTYGVNSTQEGLSTATIINSLNISGYMIDVEGEYDKPNTTANAQNYINSLHSHTNKPLGLCSYRYPNLHLNVPWKTFLDQVDFHAPQCYWIQATSDIASGYQLGRSYVQLQTLRQLPFIPIGTIVKDDYTPWEPSVTQINNFYNTVKQLGLSGYGYYDLDSGLQNLLDVVKTQS